MSNSEVAQAKKQDDASAPKILQVKKYSRDWGEGRDWCPEKRGAAIAIVRDCMGNISVCYRSDFGDVLFVRDTNGDANAVALLRRIQRCHREYMPYDQIWVLEKETEEGCYFCCALADWAVEECFPKKWKHPVRSVSLPLLESAFDRPVEGIARLARQGLLGFAPDASLTNLDAVAAAMTVFAQQLA
jgi:hypothetical protein